MATKFFGSTPSTTIECGGRTLTAFLKPCSVDDVISAFSSIPRDGSILILTGVHNGEIGTHFGERLFTEQDTRAALLSGRKVEVFDIGKRDLNALQDELINKIYKVRHVLWASCYSASDVIVIGLMTSLANQGLTPPQ